MRTYVEGMQVSGTLLPTPECLYGPQEELSRLLLELQQVARRKVVQNASQEDTVWFEEEELPPEALGVLSLMFSILIVLSQISRLGRSRAGMWCGVFKPLITCKTTSALVLSNASRTGAPHPLSLGTEPGLGN